MLLSQAPIQVRTFLLFFFCPSPSLALKYKSKQESERLQPECLPNVVPTLSSVRYNVVFPAICLR
jgi:hypothetical protein